MKTPSCLAAIVAAVLPISVQAYTVITDIHVDVGSVTYSTAGGLVGRVHADTGNYQPSAVLLYDGPAGSTQVTRPSGSQWNFLGVPAGGTLYYWPQSNVANRTYAGFEAQSIPSGTFASYQPADSRVPGAARWLRIDLVDVRFFDLSGNPGEAAFSLWTVPGVGQAPTVWMASADGISPGDSFFLTEGGHAHANWGFSRAGYYQIDLRYSGYLQDGNAYVESDVVTYHFGVEHLPVAIPEPGTIALLILAGGAWLLAAAARRRGKRGQTSSIQI